MPDTTGKFRTKQFGTTGITDEHVDRLWAGGAGRYETALIEFRTEEPHGPSADGKKKIDCVITQIEPIPTGPVEDAVRNLSRALAGLRRLSAGEPALPGMPDPAEAVQAAVTGINAMIERDQDGKVTGVWDGNPDGPLSEQVWGQGAGGEGVEMLADGVEREVDLTGDDHTHVDIILGADVDADPATVDPAAPLGEPDGPGADVIDGPWPGDASYEDVEVEVEPEEPEE